MTIKKAICTSIILPAITVVTVLSGMKQPLIRPISAADKLEITTSEAAERHNKERILTQFFEKNKSPLKPHAKKFVEISVQYNIDYRLLPAISCTESSCGKFLIPSSHNPFGWGIYGNKVTSYSSYDEAIASVAAGLDKNYFSRGLTTPEKIGPKYNPVSYKAWSGHTRFFMNQIDEIAFAYK